jgi:hypothetical protein
MQPDDFEGVWNKLRTAYYKMADEFKGAVIIEPGRNHEWKWHVDNDGKIAIEKCENCDAVRMYNGDQLDLRKLLPDSFK